MNEYGNFFDVLLYCRIIQMKRPIKYEDLVAKIRQYYNQNLVMRCFVSSGQVQYSCWWILSFVETSVLF